MKLFKPMIAAVTLSLLGGSIAAHAAETTAPTAAASFSVEGTDIGTLLDNPKAKAILDKNLPGFSDNSQIEMARSMTLKQIQGFVPDQLPEDKLIKIDQELKALGSAN